MSLRSIPLITFFIALVVCAPARAERNVANDVQAIEHVMDAFQAALIDKDKASYMDLFFSDNPADIGWQFVSEDVRLAKIRTTKPDAIKARQLPSNTFVALIDEVVATTEPRAEEFSNVRSTRTVMSHRCRSITVSLPTAQRPTGAGRCGSWCEPSAAGRSSRWCTRSTTD